MGAGLKNESDLITIKADLPEKRGYYIVTANNRGDVKAYPSTKIEESQSELIDTEDTHLNRKMHQLIKPSLQDGILTVIKDIGLKKAYNGSVRMITGEIARDITYYYSTSEQTPSTVALSVKLNSKREIDKVYGFIVQLMPEAGADNVSLLEGNMRQLPEIIDLIDMGLSLEEIIEKFVFRNIDYQETASYKGRYHCDCNYERFVAGLMLLDKEELVDIAGQKGEIPIQCHYCNRKYLIDMDDIVKKN